MTEVLVAAIATLGVLGAAGIAAAPWLHSMRLEMREVHESTGNSHLDVNLRDDVGVLKTGMVRQNNTLARIESTLSRLHDHDTTHKTRVAGVGGPGPRHPRRSRHQRPALANR